MGIYQRQFKKILAQELLRYLLEGRLPNLDELSTRISAVLGKDGKTTYQFLAQPYRSIFQIKPYNKSLNRIKFDIDLFQEELLELFSEASKRITYADLYYKVNNFNLNKLKAQLDSILFTIENADFYFLGAYDNFIDSSKIDTDKSTKNILNLSERCLNLPMGEARTQKVKISHLSNLTTTTISVLAPSRQEVISLNTVPGTSFSSIFINTTDAWAEELKTKVQGPAEIKFTFPLAGVAQDEVEVLINRLEFISHSSSPQRLKVRISTDNINFASPTGYEEGIILDNLDTIFAMDFETTLAQFIEITLRKESADSEIVENNEKTYQYLFGLKSFSAYTTGRSLTASYYSKPFVLSTEGNGVSKVSIRSSYQKPPGTDLSYYIGRETNGKISYTPINPVGKPVKSGLPEIITFSKNIENTSKFSVDVSGPGAASQYGSPFQGKVFYSVGPAISPDPVFGTVKLYRGYKLWYRDVSTTFEVIENNDVFINLSTSDIEALYTTKTETPLFNSTTSGSTGSRISTLTTSKLVYFDATKGHSLRPDSNVNPDLDLRPNYAVYKVTQKPSGPVRNNKSFLLTTSRTYLLPVTSFIIQSSDPAELPELWNDPGTTSYVPGRDYVVETEDINGRTKPTGRLLIPDGSVFLDSSGAILNPTLQLRFHYTVDPDITHKVSKIESNFITLNNCLLSSTDQVTVTYRYVPVAPSEILHPTIRLSPSPSTTSSRTYYTEGIDYAVDSRTGLIQRISSGTIPAGSSLYADFKYRNSTDGLQTFTIWAEITNPSGVQIKLELDSATKKNKLIVDSQAGEVFYVNSPQGLVDLTKSTVTNLIGPGWVQFIVRSKNPDTNVVFGTNLIDQIIQLKDTGKKKIFKEGNTYFSQLVAFREPMVQKTLNHLRVNTLMSDHQSFAIDDFTDSSKSYVVLNFRPTSTTELYNRVATDDFDEGIRPDISPETFLMTWETRSQNNDSSESSIIVRIDLERSSSSEGAQTPKVFNYQIRAST